MSDFTTTIAWFRRLAKDGGKGVVNNIDARSLGRIADDMERADRQLEAMVQLGNLTQAALEHINNPLIAMHLRAALRAAGIPEG